MESNFIELVTTALGAVLLLIYGGGLSAFLEHIPAWRDWHPADKDVKTAATFIITLLVGGLIVWTKDYLLPQYWGMAPLWLQTLVVSMIGFAFGQKSFEHQRVKQELAKQLEIPEGSEHVTFTYGPTNTAK